MATVAALGVPIILAGLVRKFRPPSSTDAIPASGNPAVDDRLQEACTAC